MALTSPKMGLRIWDALSDPYDHNQLADNWSKVDFHDHTPGRGVQIPTEGIADGAVTSVKMAAAIDPAGAYTMYKNLIIGYGAINSNVAAATYQMGISADVAGITAGSSLTTMANTFYLDLSDFTVAGRTTKIRVRGSVLVGNAAAAGTNITINLQPVTALSGATATLGAAIVSVPTFTTPALNSMNALTSADVNAPSPGFFTFTYTTNATANTSTQVSIKATLQVRQV